MKKLEFDSGLAEYRINGRGVLRFNPSDPNVYARFLESSEKIASISQWVQQRLDAGENALPVMAQADAQMKQVLSWVFGEGNDFDKVLQGVNLLAVADNGQQVVTNLFRALQPVLEAGVQRWLQDNTQKAVTAAQARRERLQ